MSEASGIINGHSQATIDQPVSSPAHPKVTEDQLTRGAAVYIRQSTGTQLRDHQESTKRQYAMKDRVVALGWPADQVVVIDDDLGLSGSGSSRREGFRRLLKMVTDEKIGLVAGLEMSRLARNSKDWSDLFEVCAIFDTLIVDEDGVFDPHDPNDRLVLGLKGIISEMELHTMKVRLERGRLNKAVRGELFHDIPVGYVIDSDGLPQLDPDASAQRVIKSFFDSFDQLGSSNALFHYLAEHNIKLPFRDQVRQSNAAINWRLASRTTVYELLKHPLYSGTYGYGRKKKYGGKSRQNATKKYLPPDQWKVLLLDRHPAYISWQQYLDNQERLRQNDSRPDRLGPVRAGKALVSGLIYCGGCGRKLSTNYPSKSHPLYGCRRRHTVANADDCYTSIRCEILDRLIAEKVLDVLSPAGVQLSLQVLHDESLRREKLKQIHLDQLQQAKYAVDVAQRRYEQVDPANRLVASTLEKTWETALIQQQLARDELDEFDQAVPVKLGAAESQRITQAAGDVSKLWQEYLTIGQQKELVRLVIQRVEVSVEGNTQQTDVKMTWAGGYQSCHRIVRTVPTYQQLDQFDQLISRMLKLTLDGKRSPEVADILATEGFQSARNDRPISSGMVIKLLLSDPASHRQLTNPKLGEHQWLAATLSTQIGIPQKRLKDWGTRGWVTVVQRPFGRKWVFWADEDELLRLQQLGHSQTGQGRPLPPEKLRKPKPSAR